MSYPNTRSALHETRQQVAAALGTRTDVLLAVSEVLQNILDHSAGWIGVVHLTLAEIRGELVCKVKDAGPPYNIPVAPSPAPLTETSTRGFGWMLIKGLSTAIDLKRIKQENHLTLSFPSVDHWQFDQTR